MLLTTELRVSGRDGRDGAVEVELAGLAAEGEVVVMAVEVAGLPAVGAVDSAFPMKSIRNPGKMRLKRGLEGAHRAATGRGPGTTHHLRLLSPKVLAAIPTP